MEKNTYRFFIDPAAIREGGVVVRDRDLAHQLRSVLRLAPGAEVTMLDGVGSSYHVRLTSLERDEVQGSILARADAAGEPRARLTLCVAMIKAERFEWLLQKGTELGVTSFVPVITARSLPGERGSAKLARWQRILREAAEQARRGVLPTLAEPQPFAALCPALGEQGLLLWEGEGGQPLRQTLAQTTAAQLSIVSGPEGGLTADEVALARRHGLRVVTLGPRTLRAETAPLVAASAILYERGDLD